MRLIGGHSRTSMLIACLALLCANPARAATAGPEVIAGLEPDAAATTGITAEPQEDHLGLLFESADGRFRVNPWLRGQFRYSDPFDGDLRDSSQLDGPPGGDFEVRRARIKIEGHLFSPNLGFYFEHELSGDHPLLDLRLDITGNGGLQARIGQYKVLYNRERVDSSGKQQFVERSISTYAFTLDRQIGATLEKHSFSGSRWDNRLWLGLFEGEGIDADIHGSQPMAVARWQWQFLGRDLSFSQSDIEFHPQPAATLAFGAATVRGPYTRFSSSGGGQLDGFAAGSDERYRLRQYLQEFAWKYRGWSVQQEFHIKHISDHDTGLQSELLGGYAQAGKAWPVDWRPLPFVAELALRVAGVDWNDAPVERSQREYSLVGNAFLAGHDNKLSLELSRLELREQNQPGAEETRVQAQWDISF